MVQLYHLLSKALKNTMLDDKRLLLIHISPGRAMLEANLTETK